MEQFDRRIACWKDTKELSAALGLTCPAPTKHFHQPMQIDEKKRQHHTTTLAVLNQDSICTGLNLKDQGFRPLVLNFADDVFPGGHVAMGSGAQEESLFRRTNYHQSLNHDTGFYPLEGTAVVYSPGITVLKDLDFNTYETLSTLDFIACPGLRHPPLYSGRLRPEDRRLLKEKIETIFQVALEHQHDSLVLGALGCGAWNNPPQEVASIFKEVCAEWDQVFRVIAFACFEVNTADYIVKTRNHFNGVSNFQVFQDVLQVQVHNNPPAAASKARS